MKIVRQDFVFGNFFLGLTSDKALGEELSDNIFSLVTSLSITVAADLRQELLYLVVLAPEERVDAYLDDTSVVHSLGVEIAFSDSLRNIAHNQKLFPLFTLVDCVVKD